MEKIKYESYYTVYSSIILKLTGAFMKIGEVSLLTNDVLRLAAFYKELFEIENDSNDETHQFIITEETTLTIYNDGTVKNNQNQNICKE